MSGNPRALGELTERIERRWLELWLGRWVPPSSGVPVVHPAVDVFECGDDLFVRIEVPGVQPDQMRVLGHSDRLVIQGVRTERVPSPPPRVYHQKEIRYGWFQVEVPLHPPRSPRGMSAALEDGFLIVRARNDRPVDDPDEPTCIELQW